MFSWPTRSGARSRFWPFGSPETTIPLVDLLVFNIGFGFLLMGGLSAWFLHTGIEAARAAADPSGELAALAAARAGDRAKGFIATRVLADPRATAEEPRFCVIHHEYKSGKSGWRRNETVPSRDTLELDNGTDRPLLMDARHVVMDPDAPVSTNESYWRARRPGLPAGGRLLEQCVPADGAVFIDGCVLEGDRVVVPCLGRRLRITPGDGTAQPRIDALAARLAGRMSMAALGLVILLAYGWRLVRARPLAEALLRWAGKDKPSKRTFWFLVAAVAVPVVTWLTLSIGRWTDLAPIDRSGYAWGALAVCATLAFAHLVDERRKRLRQATETLSSVATVGLRDARGDVVELSVRVRADAPVVTGPLTGKPRAHYGLKVERIHKSGKNHATEVVLDRAEPALVPIEDASGEGLLDLSEAALDLRAVQRVARGRGARSPGLAAALGDLPHKRIYVAFLVEERYLEPGEQLFVLGAVQRVEPARQRGNYREASTAPVIGPRRGAGMIVHAGTERSLVRTLMLEKRVVDIMLAAVLLTAVAVLGVNAAMALH